MNIVSFFACVIFISIWNTDCVEKVLLTSFKPVGVDEGTGIEGEPTIEEADGVIN